MRPIEFLVIGSGPAGLRGAIQAAKLGKRTVLVEKRTSVGGVSVHTGTIPSKTLREAVLYLSGLRQRSFYGRSHRERQELTIDDLLHRLEHTVSREVEIIRDQLLRNGVEVVEGDAHFLSPHRVEVRTHSGACSELEAEKILIATGTHPYRPNHIPFDDRQVIDSDGILKLERLPRTMTVVGSGVIGLEYASMFQALDVRISLVDERETLLDFLDKEITAELTHALRDRGVALRLGERVAGIAKDPDGKVTTRLVSGRYLRSEVVLFAAGRVGATAELNLEAAGLAADNRGRLTVDAKFRTSQPHIYAAGDVIGFPSLASTSMEQGRLAACFAFRHGEHRAAELFPFGIYAVPEMSMVGATEEQLRAKGVPYEVGISRFRELARGQILGLESGMLKLLVSLVDRKILGVHILGEGATELIHIGQSVIALGGTLDYLVESVFNYPTLAEAYKVAALDAWNRLPQPQTPATTDLETAAPEATVLALAR